MDLYLFIQAWFYYSFYYMVFSIFSTLMLNRVTKNLWLSPLIINAVSIIILLILVYRSLITPAEATQQMYFTYLPIVLSSALVNVFLYLSRKIKNRLDQTQLKV